MYKDRIFFDFYFDDNDIITKKIEIIKNNKINHIYFRYITDFNSIKFKNILDIIINNNLLKLFVFDECFITSEILIIIYNFLQNHNSIKLILRHIIFESNNIKQFINILNLNKINKLTLETNTIEFTNLILILDTLKSNNINYLNFFGYSSESYLPYLLDIIKYNDNLKGFSICNLNLKSNKNFIDIIKSKQNLINLNITSCYLGSKIKYFVEGINLSNIKKLNLTNNNIRNEGCKYIAELLKINKLLISLDLTYNKLSYIGIKIIANALKHNNTLKDLYLASNNVNCDGIKYLIDSLINNKILQKLDLKYNKIKSNGLEYISNFLKTNNTLKELDLMSNNLILDDVKYFVEILKNNCNLKILLFNDIKLNTKYVELLLDTLKYNYSIRELGYTYNKNGRYIMSFEQILNRNKIIHKNLKEIKRITASKKIQRICTDYYYKPFAIGYYKALDNFNLLFKKLIF